ncbi:MAG TPA: hypothetical protein VMU58_01305 [Gaiellaceae bacterium]|nr:hypothetical protein [Gaiellaceae bacterium]
MTVAASAGIVMNVVILAAVILGPVVSIAIFWLGIRSARRHDERNSP